MFESNAFSFESATSPAPSSRERPSESCIWTDSVTGLERIFDDAVSICVWRRGVRPELQSLLAAWSPARPLETAVRIFIDDPDFDPLRRALSALPTTEPLVRDLAELVELFATIADCSEVGVRLVVVRSTPCPRFHTDFVGLRLISTYQGPATEWLEHRDVDRRYLGHVLPTGRDDLPGLVAPGAPIHRMQPFDVGLFKGEQWPGNAGRGAVHRSPAMASKDSWRVMVTLDALD